MEPSNHNSVRCTDFYEPLTLHGPHDWGPWLAALLSLMSNEQAPTLRSGVPWVWASFPRTQSQQSQLTQLNYMCYSIKSGTMRVCMVSTVSMNNWSGQSRTHCQCHVERSRPLGHMNAANIAAGAHGLIIVGGHICIRPRITWTTSRTRNTRTSWFNVVLWWATFLYNFKNSRI